MGGTPCFKGTRVPAEFLFGLLEGGGTINEFVKSYLTVKKRQCISTIRLAEKLVLSNVEVIK